MHTAGTAHILVLKLLLLSGANADATDMQGHSACHWAATAGQLEMLKVLKKAGADVHVADNQVGHLTIITQVLTCLGRCQGRTPLMDATASGHLAVVKWLVKRGSPLFSADSGGQQPLHLAAVGGHLEVIKWIYQYKSTALKSQDYQGNTAIMWAVFGGHMDVCVWLFEHGSDISSEDNEGRTLLIGAAASGHERIAGWLLQQGVDLQHEDAYGRDALSYVQEQDTISKPGLVNLLRH